jgi:hypothetical protein
MESETYVVALPALILIAFPVEVALAELSVAGGAIENSELSP